MAGSGEMGFGVIGCGDISGNSVPMTDKAEKARIVCVMDIQEHLARELAEKVGCDWTTSQEELLKRKDVGAVYIATPHHLHAPITIACARAGKHVLVEKPISVTLAQADEMIAACKKHKVLLCVSFVGRYPRATQKARTLIRSGAIGKVIAMKIGFYTDKPETYWKEGFSRRAKTDWRSARAKSGGGILVMNCIHNYDKLRYITGLEAVRVQAETANFRTPWVEVEDYFSGTVRFSNGAIGTIYCSSAARGRGDRSDSILGTEGQIVFADGGVLRVFTTREVEGLKKGEWNEIKFESVPGQGPRQLIATELGEAVRSGGEAPVPGSEGRKSQEFMIAAYLAAETGQPIELPLKKGLDLFSGPAPQAGRKKKAGKVAKKVRKIKRAARKVAKRVKKAVGKAAKRVKKAVKKVRKATKRRRR